MVSCWEMHGSYYKFQATLSANVYYCITADQPSPFIHCGVVVFLLILFFMIMLGSLKNSHFLPHQKYVSHSKIYNKINNQSTE